MCALTASAASIIAKPACFILLLLALLLATLAFQPAHAAEISGQFRLLLPVVIQAGSSKLLSPEAQAVLDAINQARALQTARDGQPCPPLSVSSALTRDAVDHSVDMAQRHFFSHVDPDGADAPTRARRSGYSGSRIAENIIAGYATSAAAVDAWLRSPSHRANILNCDYTETGIGYYAMNNDPARYTYYWTEVFGTP